MSDLEWFNASSENGGFICYDSVKDNFETSYANGIGGTDGWGESYQEYRLNGNYSKISSKVVLNYNARTQTNEEVFLWIYGDNELLFQSQEVKVSYEPQEFTIELSDATTLKVVITGKSMVRLVDCILYKK